MRAQLTWSGLAIIIGIAAPADARIAPAPAAGAVSLAGAWRYTTEGEPPNVSLPGTAATMQVPSNWYLQGLDHSGVVWFARSVEVPDDGAWRLELGGVDYHCEVYWDGTRIGGHTGYFAPFSVAVPPRAGRHVLAIRVDSPSEPAAAWSLRKTLIKGVLSHHDTRPGGAWTPEGQDANTGGIWGDLRLVPARVAWIDDVRVTTQAIAGATAQLRLTAAITAVRGGDVAVGWRVVAPGGGVVRAGLWTGHGALDVALSVPAAQLWWPRELGQPNLYRIELDAGGDRLVRSFGIRTVVQDAAGRYLVNGMPVFLRGTNYIGSLYLSALDRTAVRRDLTLMIAANINAIRVHAHVTSPAFYDAADELGLLVWQDFPLQWGYDDSAELAAEAARQLGDMLRVLGGHPSVIHWTAQNEVPWSADWMVWKYPDYDRDQNRRLSAALAAVLETDPTRPSQVNSGSAEHAWWGWYSGTFRDFDKQQTQAVLTELGAQALPDRTTLQAFLRPDQLWPLEPNLALWDYHNFQRHELVDIAKVPIGKTLDALIHDTQIYQARLFQHAVEGLRRQAWQPVTGVFQFMFVEHWPSMNWGAVDYLRHPKLGFAALARAYQPVLAMATVRRAGQLRLYVANDRPAPVTGTLVATRTAGGRVVVKSRIAIVLPAARLTVASRELSVPGAAETLTLTILDAAGQPISENTYEPGYFKE
jgi:beta-mannosidase